MTGKLNGRRIAVLATDGFEDVELTEPVKALRSAGAEISILSSDTGEIEGKKGHRVGVDARVADADPGTFDGLLLPGGVKNPDTLRQDREAVGFVRSFFETGRPIAAICHAPWMLVEADVLRGRTLTSYPSLRTDVRNAGGEWLDAEVVVDEGLVTSRKPDDIPAFNDKMIEEFAEGEHRERRTA